MKEVFYNTQTLSQPLEDNCDSKIIVDNYACVVKEAVTLGYKKVRYEWGLDGILLSSTETLKEYCSKHSRDVNCILLLTTARHPYIDEDDVEKEEKYVLSHLKFLAHGEEYDDLCFSAAYLSDSFLVGFDIDVAWHQLKYTITDNGVESDMYCVTSVPQYQEVEFAKWIDEHDVIEVTNIQKTSIEPLQKRISLRDDHGKDVLKTHAKKLIKSPYVVEIVNSTPFKPTAKQYVDKVKENGQIEIVLMKTDAKIGMVIQTTGRNLKETLWIAKELDKKYSE